MPNSLTKLFEKFPIVDTEFAQLYELLATMPDDFDPRDPKRIQIFAKRLKEARESVAKHMEQFGDFQDPKEFGPRYCNIRKQDEVADWLGITPQRVSQFENGKIDTIPVQHLVAFYDMFNVTPHYLLGYTSAPDKVLAKNKEGKIIEVEYAMEHPVLSQKKAVHILSLLAWKNTQQFLILSKFLNSSDQTMKTGFELLDVLLKNEAK